MTDPGRQLWRNNFHPPIFSWNHTCPMVKSWYQSRNATPGPLGVPGGAIKGSDPQNGKILFLATFLEKKVPFSSRIMWDINTKPHSSKKLGVDPFLVQKWTKNCKKTADFEVAKKICLTVNFLFYCKNQLLQTLSIAWFFKSQAFCHWGVRQPNGKGRLSPINLVWLL